MDYNTQDKEWEEPNLEELVEGYQLPLDEDGEWNPKIYSAMAKVCNEKQELIIADHRPEYFSLEKIPEPTDEDKGNQIRSIRSEYMAEILNKVERYEKQKAAGLETTDNEETYKAYLLYLQYLRDIPQNKDFPDVEVLTFEEWNKL